MANPHGSFIWYELLTTDPDAAANFYKAVVGWTAQSAGQPEIDYRIFMADGKGVGGHMALPSEGLEAGMRPCWLGYVGVDDVDTAVSGIAASGGVVHMPAMDLEGVGRIAMLADPQGAVFYVMRGESEEDSTSFAPDIKGHCSWNELATIDPSAALDFYTRQFGWARGDVMPMGEMGDYQFINHGGQMIGAVMKTQMEGQRPAWTFYFNVPDIDAAAKAINAGRGSIMHGPAEIPGGDLIIIAGDPQGAIFGLVGPRIS